MVSPISRGLVPSSNNSLTYPTMNNFFERAPPIQDSALTGAPNSGVKRDEEKGKTESESLHKRSQSSSLTRYKKNDNNIENQFQKALREKAMIKLKITKIAKINTNSEKYSLGGMMAEGRPLALN